MGSPDVGAGFAAVVFAPARPDVRPGHETDVIFEVHETGDGGRALPVFTTVERLVAALGPDQPWVALPLANAQRIMGAAGVDKIALDPGGQPGARRWQESDLEALEAAERRV